MEVSTPLVKAAIREMRYAFWNFLVLKRDGTLGPVLDLRGLNKFLKPLKYKILTVPRVKQATLVGERFVMVGLKDAYTQMPN